MRPSTKRAEPAFTSAEVRETSSSRSRGRSRAISNAPNKRQPYGKLLAASGILLAVVLVSALMTTFLQAPNLDALADGDENAIELTTYNLQWLTETRNARAKMTDADVYIALTHVPPADEELESAYPGSLRERVHLVLCGHYQGGLIRLPFAGALFIPSQNLPLYGLLPGADTYFGLTRKGRTYLYVSPGLGGNDGLYPLPFFRLFNPPTVSLISLTTSSL